MTPEELAALARKAGALRLTETMFHGTGINKIPVWVFVDRDANLARFAALVAEHCAAIVDKEQAAAQDVASDIPPEAGYRLGDAATAIRTAFPMPKKDTPR